MKKKCLKEYQEVCTVRKRQYNINLFEKTFLSDLNK